MRSHPPRTASTMLDAAFAALTTQRLGLGRFRPEDLDTFVASDPDPRPPATRELGGALPAQPGAPVSAGTAGHPRGQPGQGFQFAVTLRITDWLVGDGAADVQADDPRQAKIGSTRAPEHPGYG